MMQLAALEEAAAKQRSAASEHDAEVWKHTGEQAAAMAAEREKLDAERSQMAEQLNKLQEQSQREVTAWGDAQAAERGRVEALDAQLEGLRHERTALSEERVAMATERKKLQKMQQQQAAVAASIRKKHDEEGEHKVPASVMQKRMQSQYTAQRHAYERLERLINEKQKQKQRRVKKKGGLAEASANGSSGTGAAHRSRRRRRTKKRATAHTAVDDASNPSWREVSLREPLPPPSMLFEVASLGLGTDADGLGRHGHGAELGDPRAFRELCARRAAAMEARFHGYDAATF